jgi:hypothetical protein
MRICSAAADDVPVPFILVALPDLFGEGDAPLRRLALDTAVFLPAGRALLREEFFPGRLLFACTVSNP